MSLVTDVNAGSLNPFDALRSAWYKAMFLRDNPEYMDADGIWVYSGPQGCGKTLSAVQAVDRLARRYPEAIVVSNIDINIGCDYVPFEQYEQLHEMDNGIKGLIFLLDEVHVLWNSLESKNIPIAEMAALCQMRKARRVIIGTSQVYSRIAKPIREQLKYLILCHNYLGIAQYNVITDPAESQEVQGHIQPKMLGTRFWFHSPELYQMYETLAVVKRIDRGKVRKGEYYG